MRSVERQTSQNATPVSRSGAAADLARSMPGPSAQSTKPSAGDGASGPSTTRSTRVQAAQAAQPTAGQDSETTLTRSASTQAARAVASGAQGVTANPSRGATAQGALAAQPTASQAFRKTLSRSASMAAQAAMPEAGRADLDHGRSAQGQAAQAAPSSRDRLAASRSSSIGQATQAPLALQRKWNPERSLEANPDQGQQEL
jgi:hypothetical protein